MKDINKN